MGESEVNFLAQTPLRPQPHGLADHQHSAGLSPDFACELTESLPGNALRAIFRDKPLLRRSER